MNNNLSEVERRVKRYWYTDGIGELIGGGMFLVIAFYLFLVQYFGSQSPMNVILPTGYVVFLFAALFFGRRLIHALKARVTYPRTGYIEYPATDKYVVLRRALTIIAVMAIAIFLIVVTRKIDVLDLAVVMIGALVAVVLLIKQGWSSGVPRLYFLSAISFALGVALSFSGLSSEINLIVFAGLMGIAFAISGGLTLRRYLQENPLPVELEQQNG